MRIIETAREAHEYVAQSRARRGLVPTMGALHRGHLELIRVAREAARADGELALSIFVNPLQFEPGGDFDRYPRPQSADEEACRATGVDILFRPLPNEMYFPNRSVVIHETALAPHVAIFGEKDFQQLAIIRRMVRDLNFAVEIIGAPTVREADGLACSSRNQYLNEDERRQAPILRAALREAAQSGETSGEALVRQIRARIETAPAGRIDYVELIDAETLEPRACVEPNSLLALAVFFGKTRLIDNIRIP